MSEEPYIELREDVTYDRERRMPDFVPKIRYYTLLRPTTEATTEDGVRMWEVVQPTGLVTHRIVLSDDDARNYAKAMGYKFDEPAAHPELSSPDSDSTDQVE